MARRYKRDNRGRFAAMGGGKVSSIKSNRTVKGGGESKRGSTVASRDARYRAGVNLRIAQNKAWDPAHKAEGSAAYLNRKVKKLKKTGADPTTIAKTEAKAQAKSNQTSLLRQRASSLSTVSVRRYRNVTGLARQRRYARPR